MKIPPQSSPPPESISKKFNNENSLLNFFPSPQLLLQYKEIDPNYANRILTMAEKEQEDRHKKTLYSLQAESRVHLFSMIFGFVLFLALICLAGFLFYIDKDSIAFFVIIGFSVYLWFYMYYNRNNMSDAAPSLPVDLMDAVSKVLSKK